MSDENFSEVTESVADNGSDSGYGEVSDQDLDNGSQVDQEREDGEGYGNEDGEDEALALLYKKIEERNKNKPKEEFDKREPAGSVQLITSKTQDTIFKPLQDAIRNLEDGSDARLYLYF